MSEQIGFGDSYLPTKKADRIEVEIDHFQLRDSRCTIGERLDINVARAKQTGSYKARIRVYDPPV